MARQRGSLDHSRRNSAARSRTGLPPWCPWPFVVWPFVVWPFVVWPFVVRPFVVWPFVGCPVVGCPVTDCSVPSRRLSLTGSSRHLVGPWVGSSRVRRRTGPAPGPDVLKIEEFSHIVNLWWSSARKSGRI